jgi:hypothetical protein
MAAGPALFRAGMGCRIKNASIIKISKALLLLTALGLG